MLIHVVSPSEWKAEVALRRTAWKPEANFVVSLISTAGVAKIYFTEISPLVVLCSWNSRDDTFAINSACAVLPNIVASCSASEENGCICGFRGRDESHGILEFTSRKY
jgi:hypothetical protein